MAATTTIEAIKSYLKTYSGLKSKAPMWVDFLGHKPTEYAIIPLPGEKIIETYVNGSSLRAFPFAFQSMESTADELARLQTNGFYESLSDWFETQSESGILPTLNSNKVAERIETLGWAFLFEQGESSTGIYQIQCRLVYEQS
jgi:hypothetical protein